MRRHATRATALPPATFALVAALTLATFALAAAQTLKPSALAAAPPPQERVLARRAVAPDVAIRIHNLYGSLRIRAWDRDSVVVTGSLEPRFGSFFVGGDLHAMKLGIEPMGESSDPRAWLEVLVPRGSQVWAKTAAGAIEVEGLNGGVDLYSVGGSIRVRGAPRQVYSETMAGDITIDARATWIRARTAGGSIVLRGGGEDVAATSVSGAILVEGGGVARGRFESMTGGIRFAAALDRGGSYEFETHDGSIELTLPADAGADFTVHAFQGRVRSDFGRLAARPRDLGGKTLTFAAGRGGAAVSIRTFKGDVTVRRR